MFRHVAILAVCCAFAASSSVAQTANATLTVNGMVISLQVAPLKQTYNSFWEFNGSQMGLRSEGNARSFYYTQPRDTLTELGVSSGQLQFDGQRMGSRYVGTSRVFTQNCGSFNYAVTGVVAPDDRSVTLVGWAPVLDAACAVVGKQELVNVYNLQ